MHFLGLEKVTTHVDYQRLWQTALVISTREDLLGAPPISLSPKRLVWICHWVQQQVTIISPLPPKIVQQNVTIILTPENLAWLRQAARQKRELFKKLLCA